MAACAPAVRPQQFGQRAGKRLPAALEGETGCEISRAVCCSLLSQPPHGDDRGGIETRAELDHLKREGCTEGQGFLFRRPTPAQGIPALLAASNTRAVA